MGLATKAEKGVRATQLVLLAVSCANPTERLAFAWLLQASCVTFVRRKTSAWFSRRLFESGRKGLVVLTAPDSVVPSKVVQGSGVMSWPHSRPSGTTPARAQSLLGSLERSGSMDLQQ